jgi:hypothetical protein
LKLIGRAAPFGVWRFDTRPPRCFRSGCFEFAPNVELWIDHQRDGRGRWGASGPLAITDDGTLRLEQRPSGLYLVAELSDDSVGHQVALGAGITGLSVGCQSWFNKAGVIRRAILHEVSILTRPVLPAFPGTWLREDDQDLWRAIEWHDLAAAERDLEELRAAG